MGRPAPQTMLSKRRGNSQICVRVLLLDDQFQTFFIDSKCNGTEFFSLVCNELDLWERDFFGLRYQDATQELFWLDPMEPVKKQLRFAVDVDCFLSVKYYIADPVNSLREELTRYFFFLQVKRDILQGRIMPTQPSAAGLFACILQSELGDHNEDELQPDYVHEFEFVANQSPNLEEEAEEVHKSLRGLVPSVVEKKFLDKAKWMPLYGVDLHPVKGASGAALQIGISQIGIAVFQNATRVSFFHWPKINKVQFKRKFFVVQVVVTNENNKVSLLKYKFFSTSERGAKELWRCAVEQHCFFRRIVINPNDDFSRGGGLLRSGSKFRYTGRTEFQVRQSMRAISREQPRFTRVDSRFFRRSLPPALHLPTVQHHWRSQRGLTINDNPHSKALKLSQKKSSSSDNHESLYMRLARPLRKVTGPSTPAADHPKLSPANKSRSEGDEHSPGHSKALRTVSVPSFWLRRKRGRESSTEDVAPPPCPGPVYSTPVAKTLRQPLAKTATASSSASPTPSPPATATRVETSNWMAYCRSTESSQRFTMPWCDEDEVAPPPPREPRLNDIENCDDGEERPEYTGPKVSDLYASHRNQAIQRQHQQQQQRRSSQHNRAKSLGSAECRRKAAGDYDVPRAQTSTAPPPPPSTSLSQTGESSPVAMHRKLLRSPAASGAGHRRRLDTMADGRPRSAQESRVLLGPGDAAGGEVCSGGSTGRPRFLSNGSGVGEWPWRNSGVSTGERGADSPAHEAEYLQEEFVSDEAHKRYMKKLWDEMAYADSPPPVDLNVKPKVVSRHMSSAAMKARRAGARSAVLTGSAAEKMFDTPPLATRHSAAAADPDGVGGGEAAFLSLERYNTSSSVLFQPGCSDTLPSIPKRGTGAVEKRRGITARDRRASVLGVQLFAKSPPSGSYRIPSSDTEPKKMFSASSEDGEHRMTGEDDGDDDDDVAETSGTFEMISPLQHRITDGNIARVRTRKHNALSSKHSLPVYLRGNHDDDDGDESDFGYLPGDEPTGSHGNKMDPRIKVAANGDLHLPIIAHLKQTGLECKEVNGRIASFGSVMSDDVFSESLSLHHGDPRDDVAAPNAESDQVPVEEKWFESP